MTIDSSSTGSWPSGDSEMARRIHAHDWSATALGAVESWPQSFRIAVDLLLAHSLPMAALLGLDQVLLYNDAYIPVMSAKHPEWLGQTLDAIRPELDPDVAALLQRAWAGETLNTRNIAHSDFVPVVADAWYDLILSPLRDDKGQVVGVLATALEATDRWTTERALRRSEAQYRLLFEQVDEGFCIIEMIYDDQGEPVDYRFLEVNPAFERQTGLVDATGWTAREMVPDLEPYWFEIYGRIARTGQSERFEDAADTLNRWYDVFAFRVGEPEDRQVAVLFRDIFDRRRAEITLRDNQEKQEFLLKLSDALRPLADPSDIQLQAMRVLGEHLGVSRAQYYEADETGTFLSSAGGYSSDAPPIVGRVRMDDFGSYVGENFRAGRALVVGNVATDPRVSPTKRGAYDALSIRACVGIPLIKNARLVGVLSLHQSTARTWSDSEIILTEETAERTWAAVERARAEAGLKESERRLRILVAELQHRVRNILTVVRSVFARTAEMSGDLEEVADHFKGRLDALARTQVIVTQSAAGTADLQDLIRDELISVGVQTGPLVTIRGPDVELTSRMAETLGLVIHELTTNALKYGALRVDGARLSICWTVEIDRQGNRHLDLRWREQGVPVVPLQPIREGFGRELIEEALPYRLGARATLEFKGGGVLCSITVPLETTEDDGPGGEV